MKGLSFRMGIAAVVVFLAAAAMLSLCAGQGGASVVCKAVIQEQGYYDNGKYSDLIMMRILRQGWK